MLKIISGLIKDEEGQGLAEYALILVLIAVVVIGVLGLLGGEIESVFNQIKDGLTGAGEGGEGSGS
ncbi:MAG: Flp family type IVb pilin [Dethiobacteria bacterium]|jgi:pilus assembly protein Flp/PilA